MAMKFLSFLLLFLLMSQLKCMVGCTLLSELGCTLKQVRKCLFILLLRAHKAPGYSHFSHTSLSCLSPLTRNLGQFGSGEGWKKPSQLCKCYYEQTCRKDVQSTQQNKVSEQHVKCLRSYDIYKISMFFCLTLTGLLHNYSKRYFFMRMPRSCQQQLKKKGKINLTLSSYNLAQSNLIVLKDDIINKT